MGLLAVWVGVHALYKRTCPDKLLSVCVSLCDMEDNLEAHLGLQIYLGECLDPSLWGRCTPLSLR